MKTRCKYLVLIFPFVLQAQKTVLCRNDRFDVHTANIKWYFPELLNEDGYNVYRRDSGSTVWQKINDTPILFANYKITNQDITEDPELKDYLTMVSKNTQLKDLALLTVLIKSFKSEAFSKYIGIRFDDRTIEQGKTYQYKVAVIGSGVENDSTLSKYLKAETYKAIAAPKQIHFSKGNKKVSFNWLPESNDYFGVNIYRQIKDSGSILKLTKEPIILSKTKNKEGAETYGDVFFIDSKLLAHTNYVYHFEAVDFFGSPSFRSDPIQINLKDLEAPYPPDTIYHKVDGRKVSLNWKKKTQEKDLKGFSIYRTTKSDTDFVKINSKEIISTETVYIDSVQNFGSYMYSIGCIDQDGNERRSNPYFVEVYDNEPPAIPKNLIIKSDSGRIQLSWEKNTESDLYGYLIYRTVNKNNEDTYVKITSKPVIENYFEDTHASNVKNNFLYKLVAIDGSLNRSAYSEFVSARLPDITAPQAPFLKSANKNQKGQVVLEWLPNAEKDLLGYLIFRKRLNDSTSNFTKLSTKHIPGSVNRFTDRSIEDEGIYEYFIQALDSAANGSIPSNHIKLKIERSKEVEKLLVTQFLVRYNAKKNHMELKWKIKNETSLMAYVVYKRKAGEAVFIPLAKGKEANSQIDPDVSRGIKYTYQIRVYDQRGDVFKSQIVTISSQNN